MMGPVLFDQSILSLLTSPALSALQPFFFVLTELGSPMALFIYSAIAFAIGNKDLKKIAAILIIAFLMGTLVTEDLKELVQRPRPYEGIAPVYLFSNPNSFPSGHAVAAFLAATILLIYAGWKLGLAGYAAASLIGISRIVLNVHYPTDVLGGAIIGIALGGLVIFAAYLMGIIKKSEFIQSANVHHAHEGNKKPLISVNYNYILISALFVLTLGFYDLDYMSLSLATMALAMIMIALALSSFTKTHRPLLIAITMAMIGLLAAFSTLVIGGYIVSLALIAITYVIILLVSRKMRPESLQKI
jgi:undecaprenyl-diphosphatase